jgi:hypothetical protein
MMDVNNSTGFVTNQVVGYGGSDSPHLVDCWVEPRGFLHGGDREEILFRRSEEHIDCFLKGYAIVPREKYEALQEIVRRLKTPK